MEAEIRILLKAFAYFAIAATIGLPEVTAADHVPSNFSQDLDPNYIACMMSVDDAEAEFLDALQSTCIRQMGDICSGMKGTAPTSEVIECIHVETQRGIEFLEAAANDLPKTVDMEGFFGHRYEKRRDGILNDVEVLKKLPKPDSIVVATQQGVTMASAATMLFWLARETGTPIETHVEASYGAH
jgi:hypothetical protein